ncbi:hypothetical protein [Leptothermofonsia sp. ETS-13]|uniref:hypothetical protein n=1 Tax=Leptothermofonsia sp. ETS-13 TaxID=3035696 RepID=UPI003B9E4A6D
MLPPLYMCPLSETQQAALEQISSAQELKNISPDSSNTPEVPSEPRYLKGDDD